MSPITLTLLTIGGAISWAALALLTYALFRSNWWGVFE